MAHSNSRIVNMLKSPNTPQLSPQPPSHKEICHFENLRPAKDSESHTINQRIVLQAPVFFFLKTIITDY